MIYDLIIVGAGPAGMTAGIYAARLKLKTLLITKNFGGQVASKAVAIENWPGIQSIQAPDLVKKMEEHLKSLDIEIVIDEVLDIKKNADFTVLTKNKEYKCKAVILATGSEYRHLNVPGEKEYLGKGVSHCSVCDGPLFKNKDVAIIGGGNAGFETAIFLSNIAKKIYILEFSQEVKAFEQIQDIAKASGKIEIITQASVKEIRGEKFVNSIVFNEKDKERILEVQGVFVEVGYSPASSLAKNLVYLNNNGEIIVDSKTMQTNIKGLFAAGDVSANQFKQIVVSAGEGAKATLSAHNFIKHKTIEK